MCDGPTVCNSGRNAGDSDANTRLVRVTHPFHPLSGRQLICVGERYNRYGTRLLLRIDEDQVCSVPKQWTDLVAPDPEVVVGARRALSVVADLVELAELVSRLVEQRHRRPACNGNNAAYVNETPPPAPLTQDVNPDIHVAKRHKKGGTHLTAAVIAA